MSESLAFRPPRQRGFFFHGLMILTFGGACALAFILALQQKAGTNFVLLMFISLLAFAPLPWVLYRTYALFRASYRLERDGLRLRWGLRAEDIPLPDVEWVRRSTDLAADLPLPRFIWPGAILGTVHVADLGEVEYMASSARTLLLIATPKRVYAISPENPEVFLQSFQRSLELGSLTPFSSVSMLPAVYLTQVWSDRLARWILASGFFLTMLLFAGVSLIIPNRMTASLGFYPDGSPLPAGPAAQMLLLPILGTFIFVTDLVTGLYFYRHSDQRIIAYLTWGSAVATTLLFIGAVFFILAGSQ